MEVESGRLSAKAAPRKRTCCPCCGAESTWALFQYISWSSWYSRSSSYSRCVLCVSRYAQVFMSALTVRRAQVELVVLVEYLLLFVFVAVSLVNLTLGHRIWRVYGVV